MTARSAYHLPAAHTLAVTALVGVVITEQRQDSTVRAVGSATFGPYLLDRDFIVHGDATVVIAESTGAAVSAAQKAALDGIPAEDAEDGETVWNDDGSLKVSSAP